MSKAAEIREAQDRGIDIDSGWRPHETHLDEKYDVGQKLLARPFKVTGLGLFALFTDNLDVMVEFYIAVMGFELTEEPVYKVRHIVFLRHGTEHHSLVLADKALRTDLGLRPDASCLSAGMQVGSYRQLLVAVEFFRPTAAKSSSCQPNWTLGIDYAAYVRDPDGHLIQIYYRIGHLGWDGRPRPTHLRPEITQPWPDAVDTQPDTYVGQAYLGRWDDPTRVHAQPVGVVAPWNFRCYY